MKIFVCVILTFFELTCSKKQMTKKDIVRTLKFGNCDDSHLTDPKLSYFDNITITNVGRGLNVFNGQFVHNRDVEKIYSVYEVFKCLTQVDSDCQLQGTHKHEDYCEMMEKPGEYWSPVWGSFHPSAKCPLNKGIYQIKNGTVNADKLLEYAAVIPNIKNFFWRTRTTFHTLNEREKFGCMEMMYQIAQIRV